MAAEIYSSTSGISIKHSSRSAIEMYDNDISNLTGTYTVGEIFRNAGSLYKAVTTTTARRLTGWDLGATTEPDSSIWHNYNNQADRLYVARNSVKYGFVPGRYHISPSYSKSMTDGNGYGATAHSVRFNWGSGTDSTINRYLNLPTTHRYLLNSMSFRMTSYTDTTGTNEFVCNWQIINNNSVVASGSLFNGSTPTLNTTYTKTFSVTATQTGNNLIGADNSYAAKFDMSLNNFTLTATFTVDYTSVPISTYSLTRLVY